MGDPSYEEVVDAVSRRRLAGHPAERKTRREQLVYRMQATSTDESAARRLYDIIRGAGAYNCEIVRVTDVTVFPNGFVERLDDGRLMMGWRRATVSYMVRVW